MNNLIHNVRKQQHAPPNKYIQYTIPENQSRMFWNFVCQRQLKKKRTRSPALPWSPDPKCYQPATTLKSKVSHILAAVCWISSKQWSELSALSELKNKRQQYDKIHGRNEGRARPLRPATHYWGQLCNRCQILGISDQALLRNWSFRCRDSWSLKVLKRFVCACHHPAAGE